MDLIIIGNGFDKWMGFVTGWRNYYDFINGKYNECYQMITNIIKSNKHINNWSDLEEEMFIYLKKMLTSPFSKTKIDNFSTDFLIKAVQQKYESMSEWIKNICATNESKIKKLHEIFKNKKNVHFFNFNYTEDFDDIVTKDVLYYHNPHFEKDSIIGKLCYFGADYGRINDLEEIKNIENWINEKRDGCPQIKWNDVGDNIKKQILLIAFCCKLKSFNFCKIKFPKKIHTYFRQTYQPIQWDNKWELFQRIHPKCINAYFLGFGFGKNDERYKVPLLKIIKQNGGKIFISTYDKENVQELKSRVINFIDDNNVSAYFFGVGFKDIDNYFLPINDILKQLFGDSIFDFSKEQ